MLLSQKAHYPAGYPEISTAPKHPLHLLSRLVLTLVQYTYRSPTRKKSLPVLYRRTRARADNASYLWHGYSSHILGTVCAAIECGSLLTTLQGRLDVISRDNGLSVCTPSALWHADANPFGKTIVSTCLPAIASHFNASQTEYTWVGVSYMLTQTVCQPFYGRLSDLVGRKVSRIVIVLFRSLILISFCRTFCSAAFLSLPWDHCCAAPQRFAAT